LKNTLMLKVFSNYSESLLFDLGLVNKVILKILQLDFILD